jgi:hypothetical protein
LNFSNSARRIDSFWNDVGAFSESKHAANDR